ncbi:MAG TPA: AAA domain-containing protein, partial [Puia sp.]
MLNPVKSEQFLAELELIRSSRAELSTRIMGLGKLFDSIVKAITNDEMVAFRNFYARFRYLLATLPLRDVERRNLENFRRLLKDLRKANEKAFEQGTMLTKQLLALAGGQQPVKEPGYQEGYFTRLYPKRNYAKLTDLKLLCSSWTELQNENGKVYFVLSGFDLEDLGELVKIIVRRDEYYNYTQILAWLKENAILYIQNIRSVGEEGNEYETGFDTLITLEPDYLVDATEVGECYTNYGAYSDLFFLSRLVSDLPGAAAVKGSIVGYYLDELVRDPLRDKEEIYLNAQRLYAMKAAQLGKREMQEVRKSIFTEHLPNIMKLVGREATKELWIEPTYFSTQYGLQGRLDLLCKKDGVQDIIELKSGNSPNPGAGRMAFPNHKMQVVCYDMMLESTYGKDRRGFNAVFYSKCQISPYRHLVSEHRERMQILEQRNEIVAQIYSLAARDFSVLDRIKVQGIPGLPVFKEHVLGLFQRSYEPGRIATEYYQEMVSFLIRENINSKVGDLLKEDEQDQPNGFAGLWLDSVEIKLDDFRIMYDLETVEIREGQGYVHLNITRKIDHAFRKGDLVILYPKSEDGYHVLQHHILKGSLDEVHPDRLVVCLNNKQTDYKFIRDHKTWAIEPDIFEKNYWSAISCLFNILTASARKKKLLFGHEQPLFAQEQLFAGIGLTETQRQVLQRAFDARDYFLLQGPPGTGKTSTFLVNYVRESLRRSGRPMVVLAFTNKAVDKICQAFRSPREGAAIPYLRLGSRHVQDSHLFTEQIKDDDNPDSWRKIIDGHKVFVSTVTTFHNNWQLLRQFIPFCEVVVDEASQLTEAVLSSVLALFDKFVLIGDHKQLPAVITQDNQRCKIQSTYLNQLGISDLGISLFERLIDNA